MQLPFNVDMLNHIATVGQASDEYLEISVLTWCVFRLVFRQSRKHAVRDDDRCERCKSINIAAAGVIRRTLDSLSHETCPRTRAATVCLAFVMGLERIDALEYRGLAYAIHEVLGKSVRPGEPINEGGRNSARRLDQPLSLTASLNACFSELSLLVSYMEKYVYNTGCYLALRLKSDYGCPASDDDTRIVAINYKHMGGLSEEYRRSTWHWRVALEGLRSWEPIQQILEPLVR